LKVFYFLVGQKCKFLNSTNSIKFLDKTSTTNYNAEPDLFVPKSPPDSDEEP